MKELDPKDMSRFLNEVASKIRDDKVKMGLAQCSIYIFMINEEIEKAKKRDFY